MTDDLTLLSNGELESLIKDSTLDRESGTLISRVEPGRVIERRVHGPAKDGYLTIVTWHSNDDGTYSVHQVCELSTVECEALELILRYSRAIRTMGKTARDSADAIAYAVLVRNCEKQEEDTKAEVDATRTEAT